MIVIVDPWIEVKILEEIHELAAKYHPRLMVEVEAVELPCNPVLANIHVSLRNLLGLPIPAWLTKQVAEISAKGSQEQVG